jgi:hypothetical protein
MRSATGVSSASRRLRIGGIAGSVNQSEHTTETDRIRRGLAYNTTEAMGRTTKWKTK